jgi:hypothetical protein
VTRSFAIISLISTAVSLVIDVVVIFIVRLHQHREPPPANRDLKAIRDRQE